TLTGHTNAVSDVAFDPRGHTLATASADGTARLWDITDPRRPRLLATLTGHTNAVSDVAFDPRGHTLATASFDGTARLWDVTDPARPGPPTVLAGHTARVLSVAFDPRGGVLATGGADSTVRLWDTDVARVAARVCTLAHPAVTRAEWARYLQGSDYRPPCDG
ncbi:hypothetical protein P3X83_04190, partial [Spongiactinospora sp. TRM90649]|nr:hypothetical protein [Spongiactinospora sp. TRM90649]